MTRHPYIPAFQGKQGGRIEKAYTMPQMHDALDFYIYFENSGTKNFVIGLYAHGIVTFEYFDGSAYTYEEVCVNTDPKTDNAYYYVFDASKGNRVKVYGHVIGFLPRYSNITYIDISHNPALVDLDLYYCDMNVLHLSNPYIKSIRILNQEKPIDIDVTNCPELEELTVSDVYKLDVSQNRKLLVLFVGNLIDGNLDLSNNTELEYLMIGSMGIEYLDLSNLHKLMYVSFGLPELKEIKFGTFRYMLQFVAYNTPINKLDFSNSPVNALQIYNCGLREINVSGCKNLFEFSCFNNNLRSVDISTCPNVYGIQIFGNPLEDLKLPVFSQSVSLDMSVLTIGQNAETAKSWLNKQPVQEHLMDLRFDPEVVVGMFPDVDWEHENHVEYNGYYITA